VTEQDEKYGLLPLHPVLHAFFLPTYATDAPQKIFMSSHSNTSADKFNITFPGVSKKVKYYIGLRTCGDYITLQ